MLAAVRSTSCAPASENATRELVGSAMSNPSAWVHGRDMGSPRSCCYWPYGQGEGSQGQSRFGHVINNRTTEHTKRQGSRLCYVAFCLQQFEGNESGSPFDRC